MIELCGVPPTLANLPEQEELSAPFLEGSNDIATLRANFRAAYSQACREGVIGENGLLDLQGVTMQTLIIDNLSELTESLIYWSEGPDPDYFLTVPYFGPGSRNDVPDTAALHYAIDCWARPPTGRDIEGSGRCLYD